jgi:heme oxygenase
MPKVIEILREATRSRHANLASIPAMSRLFAADYTVSEYKSHLGRMLGLIEPLERAAFLAAEESAEAANLDQGAGKQASGPESRVDSTGSCVGVKTPTYQSQPIARPGFPAACYAGHPDILPNRSSDLRSDLIAMGMTEVEIDGLERCLHVPSLSGPRRRGFTYVILGSMLGGKLIVKQLSSVLGSEGSYSFYGGGEKKYATQWASFRSDLEETGQHEVETVCATAIEIFDVYAAWLSEPL